MNSFKKLIFFFILSLFPNLAFSDNHSSNAEIVEKAKEIIQSNCHTALTNVEPVIGETIIQHIEAV